MCPLVDHQTRRSNVSRYPARRQNFEAARAFNRAFNGTGDSYAAGTQFGVNICTFCDKDIAFCIDLPRYVAMNMQRAR